MAAISLAACGKAKEQKKGPRSASESESSQNLGADPAESGLTTSAILAATEIVKPFDDWDDGYSALRRQLGDPTAIREHTYSWGVHSGDTCTYVYVTRDNEAQFFKDKPDPKDIVGTVAAPTSVPSSNEQAYRQCLRAAGVVDPTEVVDPNAPLPPKSGFTTVAMMRAGIAGARSRWVDKTIAVEGILQGISTTAVTGSNVETVTLSIASPDSKDVISCTLVSGAIAPSIEQGAPVKVTGRATDTFGGGLDNCALLGG